MITFQAIASARAMVTDTENRSPKFLHALGDMYESILRLAARCVVAALGDTRTVRGGRCCNFRVRQHKVRLRRASVRQLNAMLDEVEQFMMENDEPSGDRFSITMALTPVLTGGGSG